MKFPYQEVPAISAGMGGFYKIGHDAYHQGPGVSSSRVKKALISYAAYAHQQEDDSAALAFGRAFHAAILEPHLYSRDFVQVDGHPNSNAFKAAKAAEIAKGKTVIGPDDHEAIGHMIAAVRAHPDHAALPGFDAEVMAITTCKETGLQIKCKTDLFGHSIIDFKTTSSGIRPADFLGDIVKWNYHVSAAFYQDIIAQLTGERLPFLVVPVTKKPPYECEFYRLSDELLEEGRKLYKAGLRRIAAWEKLEFGQRFLADKRTRVLYPSARVLYNTKDTLDFIEGK